MTESPLTPMSATPFKRIFITGAGGYVGRNLVRHFVANGGDVVGLVRSEASASIVRKLGASPVMADICDAGLATHMMGCDVLIHAAADLDHGLATERQRRVNEDGTKHAFESALTAGIRVAICIASDSVLADGNPLVQVDETHPYPRKFAGGYSASKAAAEQIALGFTRDGFKVVSIRPRMVWGRDDTTAMPMMSKMVELGKFAWIGGGDYQVSTTHIANLCHSVELALLRGRGGEAYFVTDDEPVEFRSFVTKMMATQGIAAPDKTVPRSIVKTMARLGDWVGTLSRGKIIPPVTLQVFASSAVEITLNTEKARRELGYRSVVSRESGLAEMRAGTW
jgi:nucleoside-diphosphate-sugar epimerase